jgi:hypothetical protein
MSSPWRTHRRRTRLARRPPEQQCNDTRIQCRQAHGKELGQVRTTGFNSRRPPPPAPPYHSSPTHSKRTLPTGPADGPRAASRQTSPDIHTYAHQQCSRVGEADKGRPRVAYATTGTAERATPTQSFVPCTAGRCLKRRSRAATKQTKTQASTFRQGSRWRWWLGERSAGWGARGNGTRGDHLYVTFPLAMALARQARPHRLVTIPFSHYNECARWALDYSGIAYTEVWLSASVRFPRICHACATSFVQVWRISAVPARARVLVRVLPGPHGPVLGGPPPPQQRLHQTPCCPPPFPSKSLPAPWALGYLGARLHGHAVRSRRSCAHCAAACCARARGFLCSTSLV